ncbi:Gfo/Idh/MocA family oxidoreductase [Nocardia otitidiscaviarum]|uniref:Gfo/Idh/MocA family protein n=1 Tax=Nocardia otitidiscaviarum TaxID=1823 RepID=UPI0018944593|nr:Gfo/Idh/MocA family oxidoreductase [Nocardia otitidiscaviarum]MBF6240450.1 Gfo/Idh/MocA family oxidoreductase [Nocardia otitidiscaviarum]
MRVGIVGLVRGLYLGEWADRVGIEVAGICDRDPGRLADAHARFPAARPTTDWRELLTAGIDGVVLANDFDAHAPLAVAFLERGIHVLSETTACVSEDEGVRLIAAAERSTATYSFAENYVLHPHVRLLRAAVAAGELGPRLDLIEAEYLHSCSPEDTAALIGDPAHWRGRIAPTAYCTHTVSPVLALTAAWPVEVTAHRLGPGDRPAASQLTIRLSTGALAVARQGFLSGEVGSHWSWMSVRGSHGSAETVRGTGADAWSVRIRQEGWARPDGRTVELERTPPPYSLHGTAVDHHAAGTVALLEGFRATVERGAPPLIPVRPAVAAALVGVAGAESLATGSRPVPVPNVAAVPG